VASQRRTLAAWSLLGCESSYELTQSLEFSVYRRIVYRTITLFTMRPLKINGLTVYSVTSFRLLNVVCILKLLEAELLKCFYFSLNLNITSFPCVSYAPYSLDVLKAWIK
jgi:hypothetical protein